MQENTKVVWRTAQGPFHVIETPELVLVVRAGEYSLKNSLGEMVQQGQTENPLEIFKEVFSEFSTDSSGGAYGILSYNAARFFEPKAQVLHDDKCPDLVVYFSSDPKKLERLELEDITLKNNKAPALRYNHEEFSGLVNSGKDLISAGDIFQVVLSNKFTKDLQPGECMYENFQGLCERNPSPFHFYFTGNFGTLYGASPETFLTSENGRKFFMRLVAGTYPITESKKDLKSDTKEIAEHMMLVDHARNDLGRVAKVGSVRPEKLMLVETYRDLHHLVSEVSCELAEQEDQFSVFRACFPIATLTGTPKIRAMQIISELEQSPRNFFGGTAFRFGFDGSVDSTVIIRAAHQAGDSVSVQAGAGIVYDSLPEREFEECSWKAKAALGLA